MLLTSDNHAGFTIRTTSLVGYATVKFGRGQTTCTPMAHHHQSVFKTVPVRLPGLPSKIIFKEQKIGIAIAAISFILANPNELNLKNTNNRSVNFNYS